MSTPTWCIHSRDYDCVCEYLVRLSARAHYVDMDTTSSSGATVASARPLAVRVSDATRLTGIGKTKLFELIADGTLETTSIGRRRLILYRSLERLIEGPARR